ncbi:AMP-binding protein [Lentzea sp. NBRC 105346]|uniref:AMP-binding protein n=1 Tax=Lentzea sp. NBRC 105346 TaxID=3032205 RepID=UPI0024A326E9|nr:AMP-binding protein [Lentzea sp. NBRC 105346]GLZ29225.1 AMP-binding protein [Lentzea sp. NBRC 105346]
MFLDQWADNVANDAVSTVCFCEFERDEIVITKRSFGEIDEQARRFAAALGEHTGSCVVIALDHQVEFVYAFLACLLRGIPAVPLPPPSGGSRAKERFGRIVNDNDGVVIVTSRKAIPEETDYPRAQLLYVEDLLQLQEVWPGTPEVSPGDVAVVQFTSGSTSSPKGVPITHGALTANLRSIAELTAVTAQDVGVGWIPFHHDMGLVGSLLLPLHRGFTVNFMSASAFIRRPGRWLDLIDRVRATITVAPDFGYRLCVDRVPAGWQGDLSSLRTVLNGSEPLSHATLRRFEERFAGAGFDPAAWMPCYGMAEATLMVSGRRRGTGAVSHVFSAQDLDHAGIARPVEDSGRRLVSSGRPVGCEVEIRQDGRAVPDGTVGSVVIRGDSVFGGTYCRSITSVPSTSDERVWHESGDLGFFHDGELYVCGREADLISRNGVNHHAVDIERKLSEIAMRDVPSAAFGIARGTYDEAMVLLEAPRSLVREFDGLVAVLDTWGQELAAALDLPRVGIQVVPVGSLPRTTSGKVQRGLARSRFCDRKFEAFGTSTVGQDIVELVVRNEVATS